jgi:D-alanyl-D-alanine carboxypeptidase/D-alanyl-D-alanine-endopeptidase (penicillin-binding protein 4)
MVRRTIALILFAVSLVLGAMGYQAYAVSAPVGTSDETAVLPVLSPRRLPQLAVDLTQEALLRSSVNSLLADVPGATACVSVQRNGRPVVSDDVNTPFIPASTVKLLTATAALSAFEPSHTFTTRAVSKSRPRDGVVEGSLYLVGGGDPLIMTDDYVTAMGGRRNMHSSFEELADSIARAGVKSVRGGVVGDDRRFDQERYLDTWENGYRTGGQVGPIGALLVNQGFVSFGIPRGAAADPAAAAAEKLVELLRARGVEVVEGASSGVVPDDTHDVATLQSLPVSDLVTEMLTESDNTTAEVLVKNLGVDKYQSGSFDDGVRAIVSSLQDLGLPTGGVQLVDGSGLDRSNRLTCNTVAAVLARGKVDGVMGQGMAKAGESGTLTARLNDTFAVGRVYAKTGTLAGVSALAGWARPEGQQPFNFVVITNGVAGQASRAIEDQLAVMLASQPRTSPSASAFAPDGVTK